MYCTPAQLISSSVRAREIALLLGVDPLLLEATVAGSDRSDWSADEIAAADAALVAIVTDLEFADGEVNAHLAKRGYLLPQDPVRFPVLVVWARAIGRYQLHAERSGEGADVQEGRIERDYLDARTALQRVAEGKLTLGAGDPLAVTSDFVSAGAVRVTSKPRMFDRDTLGKF